MLDLIVFAVGIIFVLISSSFKREERAQRGTVFIAIIGIVLLLLGTTVIVTDAISGLPKNTYGIDYGNMLPDEDLPLVIKMGHFEEGYYYMTAAPYNKVNTNTPIYYQIPIKNLENLGDIKPGIVIINDNGILKKFPITLEV